MYSQAYGGACLAELQLCDPTSAAEDSAWRERWDAYCSWLSDPDFDNFERTGTVAFRRAPQL
jgi:hypothetical protein